MLAEVARAMHAFEEHLRVHADPAPLTDDADDLPVSTEVF
jgi:hypothetical protein